MMSWADDPSGAGAHGALGGPPAEPAKAEAPPTAPPKPPGPQEGDIVHTEPAPIPSQWHAKHISMVVAYHRLADLAGRPPYQLVEISETNLYKPGRAWFTEGTMHQINLNPQWSTRTVNFDYLALLSGALGAAGQVGIHMATGVI
jgi:hypothetical protein